MQIIDLRNTQEAGWIADVLLCETSILPVSIPVAIVEFRALETYLLTDSAHVAKVEGVK